MRQASLPGAVADALRAPMAGPIAGIDEAGRGCLAGPVVAAAVILPERYDLPGLGDSKTLSAARRETLAPAIRQCALAWGLGVVWQGEIDRINILQATFTAMSRAVACLRLPPTLLLVDGNKTIPTDILHANAARRPQTLASMALASPLPSQRAIVDGDALEPAIAAASILAKTFRDEIMLALHKRYPVYNFAGHKGYGTREHLTALAAHGPCHLHRLTFARVLPPSSTPTMHTGKSRKKIPSSGTPGQGGLL